MDSFSISLFPLIVWSIFLFFITAIVFSPKEPILGEAYEILRVYSDHPQRFVYFLRSKDGGFIIYDTDDGYASCKKYMALARDGLSGVGLAGFDDLCEWEEHNKVKQGGRKIC